MGLKRPDADTGSAPTAPVSNPFTAGKDKPAGGVIDDEAVESQIADALGEDPEGEEGEDGKGVMKWVLAIVAVFLVVALLAGAIWFASQPRNKKVIDDSSTGSSSIGKSDGGSNATNVADNDGFMSKLGIPEYYQKPNTELTEDEQKQASSAAIEAAPANAVMALPSSKSNPNLTSDPSKAFNDDGTINPDYSYITMDNVMPLIYDDLQRLVNPVYGQWTALQQVDEVDVNGKAARADALGHLASMFTGDAAAQINGGQNVQSVANVYADWNKDFYGGKYAGKVYNDPIVGVPQSFDCDFNVQGNEEDTVTCYAVVKYSGQTNGMTVEDTRKLTMDYKVNYGESTTPRRLLLTTVSQE